MSFTASYPGTCEACGARFGAGVEVEYTTRLTGLVHVQCPPSALDQQRPACPSCFLELPVSGVCEECS